MKRKSKLFILGILLVLTIISYSIGSILTTTFKAGPEDHPDPIIKLLTGPEDHPDPTLSSNA